MGSPRRLEAKISTKASQTAWAPDPYQDFGTKNRFKASQMDPKIDPKSKKSIRKAMEKSMPIFKGLGFDFH